MTAYSADDATCCQCVHADFHAESAVCAMLTRTTSCRAGEEISPTAREPNVVNVMTHRATVTIPASHDESERQNVRTLIFTGNLRALS